MDYNLRIGENYLKGVWKDGEILQHTDLNEREVLIKAAINANYADIQKILDGTYVVGSAAGVAGATLSKLADEGLPSDDDKIPSALQVKDYVNNAKQEAIDSIPDDVSAFNNDAGYILNSVNDLLNYYRKTETYTKEEVIDLVNSITRVTISIVDRLPETGETNIIYFVPKAHTETKNVFDEYIWINNDWENIGDTELDNLELDLVKEGHTATLTITKRNGTKESVEVYDGVTPNTQIGTVETLPEGSQATVTRTGTDEQPILNFGIPKGDTGAAGANGQDGDDGYSPTATVTQNAETQRTTIEITDKNGTTTAEIDMAGLSDYMDDCISDLEGLTDIDVTGIEELTSLNEGE